MSELNIPETWATTYLGSISDYVNGRAFKSNEWREKGLPIIRIQNLTNKRIQNEYNFYDGEYEDRIYIKKGDLLFCWSGTLSVIKYDGPEGLLNQHIYKVILNPNVLEDFYYFHLKYSIGRIYEDVHGVGLVHITKEKLLKVPFTLPPIQEQRRLVQKMESCFEKIDETEQNLNKVEVLLEKYRESLLAKAFRGELIPQNSDGEPASVLLSKIREEREKAESGKKSKVQAFAPIEDDEKPFEIPESWEWVRLQEICDVIADIDHKMPKAKENGVIFLSAKDLKDDGSLDFGSPKYISREDFERLSRKIKPQKNDIIYSRIGAKLGKSRVVDVDTEFLVSYSCCTIRPFHEIIDVYFLNAFLDSGFVLQQALRDVKGIGVPDLGMAKIKDFVIPLPPRKSQLEVISALKFINKKIYDKRLALSKKLVLVNKLKESILAKAFEGRLVEQIEAEGTGHELLEKILAKKTTEEVIKASKKKTAKKKVAKKVTKKNSKKVK